MADESVKQTPGLGEVVKGIVKEKFLSAALSFEMWKVKRLIGSMKQIDQTDYVNAGAAKQFMNHPQVVQVADAMQNFQGTEEEAYKNTKELMGKLSPAQQRALIMVQAERLKNIL